MSPRLALVVGLLAGILAALLIVVVVVSYAPEIAARLASPTTSPEPSPAASPARSDAPPQVSASARGSPSPIPVASPSQPASLPPSPAGAASSPAGVLFPVGEPAPALRLPRLGGGTLDLAAFRGRPVWVNFMATWCPPCRDEFPLMNGFQVRYAENGLAIVAVDVGEDEATVAAFVKSVGAAFPIALDRSGSAQRDWHAAVLPVHVWIDATGIVRDGAFGGIGPDVMARGLSTILPGVTVTP